MEKVLIYICSPYSVGDVASNVEKAKEYCKRVTNLGGIPIAPHIFFTQFLNDEDPDERRIGLDCGLALLNKCDEIWVFGDKITLGMQAEINHAILHNIDIRYIKD